MARKTKEEERRLSKYGLSRAEKAVIPLIVLVAIWVVYSFTQPPGFVPAQRIVCQASTQQVDGASDFTLPVVGASGLTGQSVSLSSFRGKVVLLEFMEPWCPHCQRMAPVLESLYGQYGSPNVIFISVAGPWQGATAGDTVKFIKDYGSGWAYLYDSSGAVMNLYGVTGIPTFFVIGKDGSVVATFEGEQPPDALVSALTQASSS